MCFAPLRKLYHLGPIIALLIYKIVFLATIYCNSQWWPPASSLGGLINAAVFLLFAILTLYNFLLSVYDGPGFLPTEWKPEDNRTKYLQFCDVCKGYKAPRSHHCSKCDRCVLKMDHHCPWLNTCVGFKNHTQFVLFLFSAICGTFQSTYILTCTLYKGIFKTSYLRFNKEPEPIVSFGLFGFLSSLLALGLSVGVIFGIGLLLIFQIIGLARNRTGIEDWILEKADYRRKVALENGEPIEPFIYPYHLGIWKNIKQVLNWEMKSVGDGITWPITPHSNCDQFTLTREQLEQKADKRQNAKVYIMVKSYSGALLPITYGCRVFCTTPYTDDRRLPLSVGEKILVTRSKNYWLFGENINKKVNGRVQKGWIPRYCAIEMNDDGKEEGKKDL